MMTMCPPEPRDDWDQILELLDVEQGYIKQVILDNRIRSSTHRLVHSPVRPLITIRSAMAGTVKVGPNCLSLQVFRWYALQGTTGTGDVEDMGCGTSAVQSRRMGRQRWHLSVLNRSTGRSSSLNSPRKSRWSGRVSLARQPPRTSPPPRSVRCLFVQTRYY
jgi:hypothetical protein